MGEESAWPGEHAQGRCEAGIAEGEPDVSTEPAGVGVQSAAGRTRLDQLRGWMTGDGEVTPWARGRFPRERAEGERRGAGSRPQQAAFHGQARTSLQLKLRMVRHGWSGSPELEATGDTEDSVPAAFGVTQILEN